MTITRRISLGFGGILALVLLEIVVSQFGLASTSGRFNDLLQDDIALLAHANLGKIALLEARRNEKDLLYGDDDALQRKTRGYGARLRAELDEMAKLSALAGDPALTKQSAALVLTAADYSTTFETAMHAPVGQDRMIAALPMRKHARLLEEQFQVIQGLIEQCIVREKAATLAKVRSIELISFGLGIAVLGIGAALAVLLTRAITRPLSRAVAVAQRIATGDLSGDCATEGNDEVAQLLVAMDGMQSQLREMISRLKRQAGQVGDSSQHLARAAGEITTNVEGQSRAVEEMTASIEEISASTSRISEKGSGARSIADTASGLADSGAAAVSAMVSRLQHTSVEMSQASKDVRRLGEDASKICNVVQVIREIADQTNLLALNAAIEAARAGEQGRGFAVVADEVRKLAERTALATGEISTMTSEIGTMAANALSSMGKVEQTTHESVVNAQAAQQAIASLHSRFGDVKRMVQDIAHSLEEQDGASQALARNTENLAQMSHQNSTAVQGLRGLTQTLAGSADGVRSAVAVFQV